MTRRQKHLYKHTCNLYRPLPVAHSETYHDALDRQYETTPAYVNVPCYFFESDELLTPTFAGQMNHDVEATIDRFNFASEQDIASGFLIELTTPGNTTAAQFWIVQGNPTDFISLGRRRSNVREIFAKQTPAPGWLKG